MSGIAPPPAPRDGNQSEITARLHGQGQAAYTMEGIMRSQGLTLIELLLVLAIMTLLFAIGIPRLATQIDNTKLSTTSSSLIEAIAMTRSQAVIGNTRATLRNLGSWEAGWEIFIDPDQDGTRGINEKLIAINPRVDGIRITANQPLKHYISFIGTGESRFAGKVNGGAFQAGTLYVCPPDQGRGYALILARGGRLRIQEITAEQCASGPT